MEARRKGEPPPPPAVPEGPYRDEVMVHVFGAVAQLAPLLRPGTVASAAGPGALAAGGGGSGGSGDDAPFLWEAIYPQTAAGRPCYNPAGRYAARVWSSGAWRAVANGSPF